MSWRLDGQLLPQNLQPNPGQVRKVACICVTNMTQASMWIKLADMQTGTGRSIWARRKQRDPRAPALNDVMLLFSITA
jgi:hypothetical protein